MTYLIILLFIIILICIMGYCGLSFSFKKYDNVEHFINNDEFGNMLANVVANYNILENSYFQNGKDIKNSISSNSTYNNIIKYPNPFYKLYPYVLKQSGDINSENNNSLNNNSSYVLKLELTPNYIYSLSLWVNTTPDWNGDKDFIYIKNMNNGVCNSDVNITSKIITQVSIGIDSSIQWTKINYYFETPKSKYIYIYIGCYNPIDIKGERYITGLTLLPYLPFAPNFTTTLGLKILLDASNPNSYNNNSLIWNDISNNNFNFIWNTTPEFNNKIGYFKLDNNIIKGPLIHELGLENNGYQEFSICIYSQSNTVLNKNSSKNNDQNLSSILLPGNQKKAFEIILPNEPKPIQVIIGDKLYKTKNPIYPQNISLYTFTYKFINGSNIVTIWINNNKTPLATFTNVPYVYFRNNIIINKNSKWNANLHLIAIYNTQLKYYAINSLYNYIINTNNTQQSPQIINFPQSNITPLISDSLNLIYNLNKQNITPLPTPLQEDITPLPTPLQEDITPLPTPLQEDITPLPTPLQEDITPLPTPLQEDITPLPTPLVPINDCPKVYIENDQYYIYISPKNKYAKIIGSGNKSYGFNKDRAADIFKANFPDCPLPDILKYHPIPLEKCPYIINEYNPCYTNACKNVKWDKNDQNMNAKCARHVSHYCAINAELDPACECWKKNMKCNKNCQLIRKKYENPEEYGFSIASYDINEHPEINKYIRKDKIPCWNCNLK